MHRRDRSVVDPRGRWLARWTFALLLIGFAFVSRPALAYVPPPLSGSHIVDPAGLLTLGEKTALDARLEDLRHQTGYEIAVLIPRSLEGETVEDVAYETFNTWKLGGKQSDSGVLLVIAPAEHRTRIETGKGVGGDLTDVQSNDILEGIKPQLRGNQYYEAVLQATDQIAATLTHGQFHPTTQVPSARPAPSRHEDGSTMDAVQGWLCILFVLFFIILRLFTPRRRRRGGWWWWGGGGGGGWGGGGGGDWGGGGGGGFSGGGGSSGGGGASNNW